MNRKSFKKKSLEVQMLGEKISKYKKQLRKKKGKIQEQTLPNLYALYGYLLANDIGDISWRKSLLDVIQGLQENENGG